jgi:mono/diheme cytochrome c family protein
MRRVPLLVWSASLALSACSGPEGDLPAIYRRLAVPYERLDTPAARERGRALFLQNCALCHGVRADGRGVRREGLSSTPRDFTDVTWQKRNSARRIFFTIREGVRGASMPAWGSLSDADAWDLVAYIRSLENRRP